MTRISFRFRRFLIAVVAVGATAFSGQSAPAEQAGSTTLPEFRIYEDLRAGLGKTFDKQNRYTLLAGTIALAAARSWDTRMREDYARRERLGRLDDLGNDILGTGVPGALIGFGLWTWGWIRKEAFEVHAGQAELEGMLLTAVASEILKRTVQRERPDGSDRLSFPSAHTSTMAATSMALAEFYGWKAGAPAFALTALTALSRISDDKHWLSDTVGGAVVGMVFAHASAEVHFERMRGSSGESHRAEKASRFFILPVFDAEGEIQLMATRSF